VCVRIDVELMLLARHRGHIDASGARASRPGGDAAGMNWGAW
jgi:hypothetical protein